MTVLTPRVKAEPRIYPEGARRSGLNGMAIMAAITGVLLFAVPVVPLFCGGIARSQIRRTGQSGLFMAAFGVAVGAIGSALWIGFWIVVLAYKGITITLPSLPF